MMTPEDRKNVNRDQEVPMSDVATKEVNGRSCPVRDAAKKKLMEVCHWPVLNLPITFANVSKQIRTKKKTHVMIWIQTV